MKAAFSSSIISLALLAIVVLSCNGPTGVSGSVSLLVQTDKSTYSLATDTAAEPLLINQGSVPVYAPMNEYVAVQQLQNGGWTQAKPWFSVDGAGISFRIMPGDTLRALPMDFAYVGDAPGRYRFIFEIARDSLGHQIVAENQRVSPPFDLEP
jgi:hypothetical protein